MDLRGPIRSPTLELNMESSCASLWHVVTRETRVAEGIGSSVCALETCTTSMVVKSSESKLRALYESRAIPKPWRQLRFRVSPDCRLRHSHDQQYTSSSYKPVTLYCLASLDSLSFTPKIGPRKTFGDCGLKGRSAGNSGPHIIEAGDSKSHPRGSWAPVATIP